MLYILGISLIYNQIFKLPKIASDGKHSYQFEYLHKIHSTIGDEEKFLSCGRQTP